MHGEAGAGKTTLVQAARQRSGVGGDGVEWLWGACEPRLVHHASASGDLATPTHAQQSTTMRTTFRFTAAAAAALATSVFTGNVSDVIGQPLFIGGSMTVDNTGAGDLGEYNFSASQ